MSPQTRVWFARYKGYPPPTPILFILEEEEVHSDADKVDAVVEKVTLQANTVGQSAAHSQGSKLYNIEMQIIAQILSDASICMRVSGKSAPTLSQCS